MAADTAKRNGNEQTLNVKTGRTEVFTKPAEKMCNTTQRHMRSHVRHRSLHSGQVRQTLSNGLLAFDKSNVTDERSIRFDKNTYAQT